MPTKERYDIDVSRYEGHTQIEWQREGTLVFALQQRGWRHGAPQMENRFSCDVQGIRPIISYEEREANAKLIVDAPKLLAAYQAQAQRIEELKSAIREHLDDPAHTDELQLRATLDQEEGTNADE